ncbi:MAG: zinc ribbon domain-containing protein [Clostridia bacterium]|nr:zinc ribbon domain-containing protein [Clostridia bacterium]
MGKFCGKCGTPLDNKGKCPKCDAVKTTSKAPLDPKTYKIIVTCLWSFLSVLIVTAIIICLVVFWPKSSGKSSDKKTTESVSDSTDTADENTGNADTVDDEDDPDLSTNYEVPDFDAETYFNDNTTLHSVIDVQNAPDLLTESDVYDFLYSRGFSDISVICEYDINGNYIGEQEVSSYSSDVHPMYQCLYAADNGDWQILVVNDSIFAVPMFYNYSDESEASVILSETDTITSFDRATNKFYINVPTDSDLRIINVAKITAELLNGLTVEGIAGL